MVSAHVGSFCIYLLYWLLLQNHRTANPKGADAGAGIYTLVETARANSLVPKKYLNIPCQIYREVHLLKIRNIWMIINYGIS